MLSAELLAGSYNTDIRSFGSFMDGQYNLYEWELLSILLFDDNDIQLMMVILSVDHDIMNSE